MAIKKMALSGVTIRLPSQVRGSIIQSEKSVVKKLMTKEEKGDGAVPDMSIKNETAKSK